MTLKKKVVIIIRYETENTVEDEFNDVDRILTSKVPHYWEATHVIFHAGGHVISNKAIKDEM